MVIPSFRTLHNSDFNFATATNEDIYFAYIVTVPFRFLVNSPYHCHFQYQNYFYDIRIENKALASDLPGMRPYLPKPHGGGIESLWSTVVIIPNTCNILPDDLATIRDYQNTPGQNSISDEASVGFSAMGTGGYFSAMQGLNAFIIGYCTASGTVWGGGRSLQTMTTTDFFNGLCRTIAIIGVPIGNFTADMTKYLFDPKHRKSFYTVTQYTGGFSDLPAEKLAGIEQSIDRLNNFYFYELAFEAKAKMANQDHTGALLMAVAALEGVHSAFVNHALESRLPLNRTGEDKTLEEDFIRELGFSLCSKLTPYIFMNEHDRPSPSLIKKVSSAITYRNNVMHALRNSKGEYKIRLINKLQLSEAFSDTFELYELYRKAFEQTLLKSSLYLEPEP